MIITIWRFSSCMRCAGAPRRTESAGQERVTFEPAPTMQRSPSVIPFVSPTSSASSTFLPSDGAAAHARVGDQHRVRADPAVVRDVAVVVYLHAVLDDRLVHRRAVHGAVAPDLDVVADLDRPDLRHLHVAALDLEVAEAVAADRAAAVDDRPAPDAHLLADGDVGVDERVRADGRNARPRVLFG